MQNDRKNDLHLRFLRKVVLLYNTLWFAWNHLQNIMQPTKQIKPADITARLALEESKRARKIVGVSASLSALAIIASLGIFVAQQIIESKKQKEEQSTRGKALIAMMGGFYNGQIDSRSNLQEIVDVTVFERKASDRYLYIASMDRLARQNQYLISDIRETIANPSSSPVYRTIALQMIVLVRSITNLQEMQADIVREKSSLSSKYIETMLAESYNDVDRYLRETRLSVQVNSNRNGDLIGASCFFPPKGYRCDSILQPLPGFGPTPTKK